MEPLKIHSVLFNKKRYSTTEARKFLKNNNLKAIKRVDITDKYLRYRITKPNYSKYDYRSKNFGPNIIAVFQIPKKISK